MRFNYKKLTVASVAIFLSIGTACAADIAPIDNTPLFSDIGEYHEFYVPIAYLKEQGLVQGYDDGTFKPYNEINRAEALKLLVGAIPNIQDPEPGTPEELIDAPIMNPDGEPSAFYPESAFYFEDVSPTEWYFSHIRDAWTNNIVAGYPDGLFHPEQTINRAESLKIVLLQEGLELPVEITEPPYTDVPVDAWFASFAKVSRDRTLIMVNRSNGGMSPEQNMNRGEFAELIYKLLKSKEGSTFVKTTWYGFQDVNWGTASGEKFNTNLMTAAHKTLPFGTRLLVTNLSNGKQIEVKINDRGPYPTGIDLDLTSGAFEEIASLGAGIINTEYVIVYNPKAEATTIPNPATSEYTF